MCIMRCDALFGIADAASVCCRSENLHAEWATAVVTWCALPSTCFGGDTLSRAEL